MSSNIFELKSKNQADLHNYNQTNYYSLFDN
jgi:hypothetical protein